MRYQVETPESVKAFQQEPPGESYILASELFCDLLQPVDKHESIIQDILSKRVDELFVHISYLCGRIQGYTYKTKTALKGEVISSEIKSAIERRKQSRNPSEDVDRKKILQYARVRKISLFNLRLFLLVLIILLIYFQSICDLR